MNKTQKEIIGVQLNNEKSVLNSLKKTYKQAEKDIDDKIAALLAREDTENLQSIIYQVNYQKALKTQISGILDNLNGEQFNSISEYLTKSYEDGFIGTMYDLQNQGIPLVFPIDQQQVKQAILHDTKLSKSLYATLGQDTEELKKRIQSELSRGISQSYGYSQIAKNISNQTSIGYNKAARIAQTEGHRISSEATFTAQKKAKDAGADVVKQWDATIDKRTRRSHAELDGQIREIDEPFEYGGHSAMYPGGFGIASQDINCRCAILQRARWALDEEEITKWDNENGALVTIKAKDYNDFKMQYQTKVKEIETQPKPKVNLKMVGSAFTTKAEKDNTQKLVDYVNNLEGANPNSVALQNRIEELENFEENGIKFKISHASNHAVRVNVLASNGKIVDVTLTIPKLYGDDLTGQVNTMLHERIHLLDLMLRSDPTQVDWFSLNQTGLVNAVKNTAADMSDEIENLFKQFNDEVSAIEKTAREAKKIAVEQIKNTYLPNGLWGAGADYKNYEKEIKKLEKATVEQIDYASRNAMGGGVNSLQDIFDALSGGSYRDNGVVIHGHGGDYYKNIDNQVNEIIANYGAISVTRPDLVEMLRRNNPELVDELEKTIEEMLNANKVV